MTCNSLKRIRLVLRGLEKHFSRYRYARDGNQIAPTSIRDIITLLKRQYHSTYATDKVITNTPQLGINAEFRSYYPFR